MKSSEIVTLIKEKNPDLLGGVADGKAARIISEAMQVLNKQIDATQTGVLKVPGLGVFRVRQVEREKNGQKEQIRKVIFNASAPRTGKKKKGSASASQEEDA